MLGRGHGAMEATCHHLLIVEDDSRTAAALAEAFEQEGFEVSVAHSAEEAFEMSGRPVDLAILDWMLPEQSGVELLQHWRAQGIHTPVILLTARDAVTDRVLGLESGADDYLAKPFAFAELLARVRALLRRISKPEPTAVPMQRTLADLTVDYATRLAMRGQEPLPLTPREFDLLAYLMARCGEAVSRDELARGVWREPNRATPIDNIIDVHMTHLRRKMDEGRDRKLLHTIRGVGFILREEAR